MRRFTIIFVWCLCAAGSGAPWETSQFAVVLNRANPASSMRVSDLRDFYTGAIRAWNNGAEVVLVVGEEQSAARRFLLERVLQISGAEFHRRMARAEHSRGRRVIVRTLNSDAAACKFVFNVPGAVAVVSAGSLEDAGCAGIKTARVDGVLPFENGAHLQ